jgi:LDH2 family malate/lactate/ureidoglycolate dehydrogenase
MDEHGTRHLFYGEGGGMDKPHLISAEKLRGFGKRILEKVGVAEPEARITAEILVDANLRGIDTHGIYLCDVYARRLQKGLINPTPNFRFKKKRLAGL